jgi:hypothetical protein
MNAISFDTLLHRCAIVLVVVVQCGGLSAVDATTATAQPSTPIQSVPAKTPVTTPLPHGACPARYDLSFIEMKWIRCSLKRSEIEKGAPKMSAYVAPTCDSGYMLRDAQVSGAPEKNMYRCVKFQR